MLAPSAGMWSKLALAAALALLALAARPTLTVVETPANARRKGGRKPRS